MASTISCCLHKHPSPFEFKYTHLSIPLFEGKRGQLHEDNTNLVLHNNNTNLVLHEDDTNLVLHEDDVNLVLHEGNTNFVLIINIIR